jgi:hypothetical protein
MYTRTHPGYVESSGLNFDSGGSVISRHTTWVLDHHDVAALVEVRWRGGSLFQLFVDRARVGGVHALGS